MLDAVQMPGGYPVRVDRTRDSLLTDFGRATLTDRYLMPGEEFQDLFARVASFYGDDQGHAQRIYDYMSRLWFMPATPVLSNGGTARGLPISCFLNEASDSLEGIVGLWNENVWLASKGGGIGSYWGNLRSIGEKVGAVGKTSGVIPFIRVMDSLTLAISQGSLRRGSAAVYLPVSHPEIEEFIELRRPTGGDPNRKALNLHHGIQIPDAFMRAVEADEKWALRSPKDKSIVREISARALWVRILTARIETGEPYLIFSDHVARAQPRHPAMAGLEVKTSNLCREITLPTGSDHHGVERTRGLLPVVAEFGKMVRVGKSPDLHRGRDAVPGQRPAGLHRSRASGHGEGALFGGARTLGRPWRDGFSLVPAGVERPVGKRCRQGVEPNASSGTSGRRPDTASMILAEERGACPDAEEYGSKERFSPGQNVAGGKPTASISIIAGNASHGIEADRGECVPAKERFCPAVSRCATGICKSCWSRRDRITTRYGRRSPRRRAVCNTWTFLTDDEKALYKTAFELDQRWIIEHAADRAPFICQSQSVNVFLPANVGTRRDLHQIHFMAWKRGVKSLYYCRSLSIQRADNVSVKAVAPER